MGSEPLTIETANAIYDILRDFAGAPERGHDRESFVVIECERFCSEYRFMGKLGFGGKFWRNDGKWYVTCYLEDAGADTKASMEATNKELAKLKAEVPHE